MPDRRGMGQFQRKPSSRTELCLNLLYWNPLCFNVLHHPALFEAFSYQRLYVFAYPPAKESFPTSI